MALKNIDARQVLDFLLTHPVYMGSFSAVSPTNQLKNLIGIGKKLDYWTDKKFPQAPAGSGTFKDWFKMTLDDIRAEV